MSKRQARRARMLRRTATRAERILWRAMRAMPLRARARRQHPIGRYIADFAVPASKLVIEIDGGQHATAIARDAARSRELEAKGWRVIRFWNGDVTSNLEGVLQVIAAEIERIPSSPRLSPPQGGEGVQKGTPTSQPRPPSALLGEGVRGRWVRRLSVRRSS